MSKWRRRKHRISRKDQPDIQSVGTWSRMIHKGWIRDVVDKHETRKLVKARDFESIQAGVVR